MVSRYGIERLQHALSFLEGDLSCGVDGGVLSFLEHVVGHVHVVEVVAAVGSRHQVVYGLCHFFASRGAQSNGERHLVVPVVVPAAVGPKEKCRREKSMFSYGFCVPCFCSIPYLEALARAETMA